jgi:hypothetical protein
VDWFGAVSLLALACSVLALACGAWAALRSIPAAVRRQASSALDGVTALESEWAAYQSRCNAALAAHFEEAERVLDAVERKRKSIAGSAGKLAAAQGANGSAEPDLSALSPEEIRAHYTRVARGRGLL